MAVTGLAETRERVRFFAMSSRQAVRSTHGSQKLRAVPPAMPWAHRVLAAIVIPTAKTVPGTEVYERTACRNKKKNTVHDVESCSSYLRGS